MKKKSKTGTLSIRFKPEDRELLDLASTIYGESRTGFLRNLFKTWLSENKQHIKESLEEIAFLDHLRKSHANPTRNIH